MIDNPEFKGPWKPKMIDNPDYKGKWVHPKIPNPAYKYDEDMYKVCKDGCTHVGFELWQVKTGTLFDDILVTDSLEEAKAFAKETFEAKKDKEKEMYDKIQEEKKANEPEMPDYDDMDMGDLDDTEEGLDDLGGEGDDLDDLGADEEETVTLTKSEFDAAVQDAMDMVWDKCCGDEAGGDLGLGEEPMDDFGGADDGLDADDEGGLDLDDAGLDDLSDDDENFEECATEENEGFPMESVNKIANLLTEDPDVFRRKRRKARRK